MDSENNIYSKNLCDQNLPELADMCANVAFNVSAERKQSDTAHALRVEWVRLSLDHASDDKAEALRTRMLEFLSGVPAWMMAGL